MQIYAEYAYLPPYGHAESSPDVTDAFGTGPVGLACGSGLSTPQEDMDLSRAALTDLVVAPTACSGCSGRGRPPRSAGGTRSRPDSPTPRPRRPSTGSPPVIRPVGGRLAAYHRDALVLDLVGPHPAPHGGHRARFAAAAAALTEGLRELGVDARPGAVPGEYCPGEFSVNARGATKLIGTAQRLTRHGYLFSVVVLVGGTEPVRAVLAATYPRLGWNGTPDGRCGRRRGAGGDGRGGRGRARPRLLSLITSNPTLPVIEARERPARSW